MRTLLIICLLIMAGAVYINKDVKLRVFNPYKSINIKLNIKCDWNNKTGQYGINKNYNLNAKGSVVIKIPAGADCQLWPTHR